MITVLEFLTPGTLLRNSWPTLLQSFTGYIEQPLGWAEPLAASFSHLCSLVMFLQQSLLARGMWLSSSHLCHTALPGSPSWSHSGWNPQIFQNPSSLAVSIVICAWGWGDTHACVCLSLCLPACLLYIRICGRPGKGQLCFSTRALGTTLRLSGLAARAFALWHFS